MAAGVLRSFFAQFHSRLFWCSVPFAPIALRTGRNDIVTGVTAALRDRYNMFLLELAVKPGFAAIGASIAIIGKNLLPFSLGKCSLKLTLAGAVTCRCGAVILRMFVEPTLVSSANLVGIIRLPFPGATFFASRIVAVSEAVSFSYFIRLCNPSNVRSLCITLLAVGAKSVCPSGVTRKIVARMRVSIASLCTRPRWNWLIGHDVFLSSNSSGVSATGGIVPLSVISLADKGIIP